MKEIIAIIRMNKVGVTKDVLAAAGYPAATFQKVLGRGRQRGLVGEVKAIEVDKATEMVLSSSAMEFVPKRMITIIVDDKDVERVINIIMAVNRTGQVGDGKIFVLPVEDSIRIRTREKGFEALV
ncbi:nitrogen regulatory protein P-II [Caldicellulosiruptor saccharolyticus DSM 8903]|uniref:Nitrogen regulatory protein P-II n=1 Tax=Caldicellulosiruptor saccharolyticus (strain ATCC 43494 / DSM 8903 / Tp8T 6331) TaxID=351627 RepID=A4XMA6_CALS8|nr:P-II family nitrogen regulator [Caldicellulosiruptor saccharolyticus]ABP68041.1 nitrogen regulatory protein P-II [Caldicellulosiruptor saccharolyticus DSM 8903]